MQLKKEVSHCRRLRTVFQPFQKATAVIIRGLAIKFKMMLYFDFDCKMDLNLLLKLITEVEERADAHVACVVMDMGNQAILKELGTYEGETKVIFHFPLITYLFVSSINPKVIVLKTCRSFQDYSETSGCVQ